VVELILIDSIAALAKPTRPDGLCAASYVVSCVFNVFTQSFTWACSPAPEFKFWVFLRRIAVHVAAFGDLDCEVSRPINAPTDERDGFVLRNALHSFWGITEPGFERAALP
jgi:hypothetical protein